MSAFARAAATNLRAARARAYVRVVAVFRELPWLLSDALFPAIGMCAFVLLYRAMDAPRSLEAIAVVGGVLMTYWLNVLWSMGAQLYWEKQQGQLQLLFVAPCSVMAILAGMAVGGIVMTTTRALTTALVGFLVLGVRVDRFDPLALLVVFVLTMTALYGLGMTIASLFLLWGRQAWHICNAFQEPVYFVSGLYFPIRTLGAVGAIAAGIVPLGFGLDAIRQVLLGAEARGLLPVATEAWILAALTIVFLVLAHFALSHLERLSKQEGRLTTRWQ